MYDLFKTRQDPLRIFKTFETFPKLVRIPRNFSSLATLLKTTGLSHWSTVTEAYSIYIFLPGRSNRPLLCQCIRVWKQPNRIAILAHKPSPPYYRASSSTWSIRHFSYRQFFHITTLPHFYCNADFANRVGLLLSSTT